MSSKVGLDTKVYNQLWYPLVAVGLYSSLSIFPSVGAVWTEWKWFNWHPLAMSLAFVPFAGMATLLKKIGGCVCVCVCVCVYLCVSFSHLSLSVSVSIPVF